MINQLPSPKTNKGKVRKGRGYGSGLGGHTVGRGTKGQKSRSGYSRPRPGFEGGQMPLSRRLPKLRGLSNKSRSRAFKTINTKKYLLKLTEVADKVKGSEVNNQTLLEAGLIQPTSKKVGVKIVCDGKISKKLQVSGVQLSGPAKQAIEAAGGTAA